jgi:hypothetical protein
MTKRALCVGINDYPGDGSDLKGCVNDANAWAALLRDRFGFAAENVTLLLDQQATKAAILKGLRTMVTGAKAGDELVFTNSSHGTYVTDADGDDDLYDEALCPYDCAKNLIVDDELRELFALLPKGVKLTMISDSCHSGTVTRAAIAGAPDERRVRFLDPSLIGRDKLDNPRKAKPKNGKFPEGQMKEVLLSGCTPIEYSYDALIDGTYHGAMTHFALKAIRDADYDITWSELHETLGSMLELNGYPQHPCLEGADTNKARRIFA